MKSTEERELKLGAGPGFRLPELAGELLPPRTLTSVYLDTPDHRPPARASPPCWRRSCEFIEDPHERPVGVLEVTSRVHRRFSARAAQIARRAAQRRDLAPTRI